MQQEQEQEDAEEAERVQWRNRALGKKIHT